MFMNMARNIGASKPSKSSRGYFCVNVVCVAVMPHGFVVLLPLSILNGWSYADSSMIHFYDG